MAVGFSMFIRLANDRARPSCGVAEVMMSVSERVDSSRATLARIETCAPEPRSATFCASSMTMMSQYALSR